MHKTHSLTTTKRKRERRGEERRGEEKEKKRSK
jgi:hypothetical protein